MRRRRCFCTICPHCRTTERVSTDFFSLSWLRKKWWVTNWCAECGSRWQTWHWLEQWTGATWRCELVVNPGGGLQAVDLANLVALQAELRRRGVRS